MDPVQRENGRNFTGGVGGDLIFDLIKQVEQVDCLAAASGLGLLPERWLLQAGERDLL